MWIYQRKKWPDFTWDDALLAPMLANLRHIQGHLLGRMESLGFDVRQEASLETLTSDVVTSSAIEGEMLNLEEVRSSLATRLGVPLSKEVPISRDVDGIVEMMFDATQNFKSPFTKERLLGWHASLFPTGYSGIYRIKTANGRSKNIGAMQVVSGPIGREKIHFEAPEASKLTGEMAIFFSWMEKKGANVDSVIKAAIAHLWFVTIHPFEDGNGRIARAIADMMLARADNSAQRFYSMSAQIKIERKEYYKKLENQQRSDVDITDWLIWFLACLERAIHASDKLLEKVLYRVKLYHLIENRNINRRQKLILRRMLDDFKGHMNTSKYAKMAKCSPDTALRDIRNLLQKIILCQNPEGGRSTSYRLATIEELKRIIT